MAILKYFRGVKSEAKKVQWPAKRETMSTLMLVLVVVVLASLFLGLVDWAVLSFVQGVLV